MRGQPFINNDFRGGVNIAAAPYAVNANQARDLFNMTGTLIGSARKRNGFWSLCQPARPPKSLAVYERGAVRYVLVFGDNGSTTTLQSMTVGGTLINIKGANVITSGAKWDHVQAPISGGQGPTYFINAIDPPLQWAGSGNAAPWTATSGVVPNGKFMIYHDNRVLVAGVTTDYTTRSMLYASALADPRIWSSPDGITTRFDPEDGQEITGLGTVGPYALVFKPRKMYVVTDTDTLFYRNLSDEKGCVAHRTICNTPFGTFFLTGDRNVCLTDGSRVDTISDDVQPYLDLIPSGQLTDACATYVDDRYYISFSTGQSENDMILEYNTRTSSWWPHRVQASGTDTEGINDWAIIDPAGDSTLIAAGSLSSSPRVYEAFKDANFNDRGNIDTPRTYPSYWVPGWQDYGQPNIRKIVTQVRVDHKGNLNFEYAKSFGTGFSYEAGTEWETSESDVSTFGGEGTFGGDGIYGDVSPIFESRYYTLGAARAWSYKYTNRTNTYFELYNYTVGVEMRSD